MQKNLSGRVMTDLYVATDGSDSADGSLGAPFATLSRALQEVATIKAGGLPAGGVTVNLRAGIHYQATALVIDSTHSGESDKPITIQAYPGETARISGGQEIINWSVVTDQAELDRLHPNAAGNAYRALLSESGISDYGQVSDNIAQDPGVNWPNRSGGDRAELTFAAEAQQLARWPKDDFVFTGAFADTNEGIFNYLETKQDAWASELDPWALGYWRHNYAYEYKVIGSVDTVSKTITLSPLASYYNYAEGKRYCGINLMCELSQSGDWYLDRTAGVIYFWPPSDIAAGIPTLSMTQTLATVSADWIVFAGQNLVLESTRGTGIEFNAANDCILSCTVRNTAGDGVLIDGGARVSVENAHIHGCGDMGVKMVGGDRITLTHGEHRTHNSKIHNWQRWNRTYNPAVWMEGVGLSCTNNDLYDSPQMAVYHYGNNHLIEYNDIYDVVYEGGDSGAIYSGQDWSFAGSIIRYNKFTNIPSWNNSDGTGIYFDDMLSNMEVYGNTFDSVVFALRLGGGRSNNLENNVSYNCTNLVRFDDRGLTWAAGSEAAWTAKLEAMPYQTPPWSDQYPQLVNLLNDGRMEPKYNTIDRNISWQDGYFIIYQGSAATYVTPTDNLENNVDPQYTDPDNGDFSLQPGSPAYALGITDIPYDQIGVQSSGSLTNETLVGVTDTTADVEITSDSDQGELHAAIRTSGPYSTGDENAIKLGTGADWDNTISPEIGVNAFSASSLTPETSYHCGFVQEVPGDYPPGEYYHEFNGDMGFLSHTRSSTSGGYDANGDYHEVANDVPVFHGCSWTGSGFAPDDAWRGLQLSRTHATTMAPNHDFAANWTASGLDVGTTKMLGELQLDRCRTTTTAGATAYVELALDGETSGPWYWGALAEQGDATQITLEISGDRGRVTFDWNSNSPTVASEEFAAYGSAKQVTPTLWAFYLQTDAATNATKTARIYPHGMGTVANGADTWVNGGTFLESDRYMPPDFLQVVTPRTVADTNVTGTMPVTITQDFSLQYHIEPRCENGGSNTNLLLIDDGTNGANQFSLQYNGNTHAIIFRCEVNDSVKNIYGSARAESQEVDIRIKREGDTMTLWVDGVVKTTTHVTGAFGAPLTRFKPLGVATGKASHILKRVRIYDTAQDITAWTNDVDPPMAWSNVVNLPLQTTQTIVPPIWDVSIPPQTFEKIRLPADLNMNDYLQSDGGTPVTSYADLAPVAGVNLNTSTGVYNILDTVDAQTAAMQTTATNSVGTSEIANWSLEILPLPLTWEDPGTHVFDLGADIPTTIDMKSFISSFEGTLDTWVDENPQTGINLLQTGVYEITDQAVVSTASMQTTVSDDFDTQTSLQWTIQIVDTRPSWDTPISDQTTLDTALPANIDVSSNVSGQQPITFSLEPPVTGFDIVANEVQANSPAPGTHAINVRATNATGTADDEFDWHIHQLPAWLTIPGTSSDTNQADYDLSPYVDVTGYPVPTYELAVPVTGFSVPDPAQPIVRQEGAAIQQHALTIRASSAAGDVDEPFTWDVTAVATAPNWGTTPADQTSNYRDLPVPLDVSGNVSGTAPITFSLIVPVTGFDVVGDEVIAQAGAPTGISTLGVRATNVAGQADTSFEWTINRVAEWVTIPPRSTTDAQADYDVSSFRNVVGYPAPTYSLVGAPAGFSIPNDSQPIIRQEGASATGHSITIQASNSAGDAEQTFVWTVSAQETVPVWSPPIPDQVDLDTDLPQTINVSGNLSGNPDPAVTLVPAVTGFDVLGKDITAQNPPPGLHNINARATNTQGVDNTEFTWEIRQIGTWKNIPARNSDTSTNTYDLSSYVDKTGYPAPTYTLVSPPAGFSVPNPAVPTVRQSGAAPEGHTITMRAANSAGNGDKAFTWNVYAIAQPPVYGTLNVDTGDSDPIDHAALWSNTDTGSWSAVNLPTGRTLDPVTGVETGSYDAIETVFPVYTFTSPIASYSSSQRTVNVNEVVAVPPDYQPFSVDMLTSDPIDHAALWTNADQAGGHWTATGIASGRSIDPDTGLETGQYINYGLKPTTIHYEAYGVKYSSNEYIVTVNQLVPEPVPPTYQNLTVTEGTSAEIRHADLWQEVGTGKTWSATGLPAGRSINPATGVETGVYQTDGVYNAVTITYDLTTASPYQVTVEELQVPTWGAIPDQISAGTQAQQLYLVPYVTSQTSLKNWMVSGDTAGVRMYQTGQLEVGPTDAQAKTLQVTVENDAGVSLPVTINWTVEEGLLYGGQHLSDAPGSGQGSVSSLTDQGTLYAACRLSIQQGGKGAVPEQH